MQVRKQSWITINVVKGYHMTKAAKDRLFMNNKKFCRRHSTQDHYDENLIGREIFCESRDFIAEILTNKASIYPA